ncbi:uncharacterized protein BDR25DRAFT_307570 [Lindgomyces ingoldianus]|uniref:Uncharacterized protein n=1 Tax=Lindgomyces ingoldianus TaxID=673940 RepID=A0ACB6QA55_9PLEO|nr:uncharacterized protein BDR25DRAFT_307570 [Lindgomyces ingoldianus]KAF2463787.1 hypothetical protein BDR25DRAFT_307570 [Lindgomyces ingoldianus]
MMFTRFVAFSLALLSASRSTVQAQCQPENPVGGSFTEPPPCGGSPGPATYKDNRVMDLGSVQGISWTTNLTVSDFFNLTLWQQNGGGGATVSTTPLYIHNENDPLLESMDWVVQAYELNLDRSNVFYLEMGWEGPRFFSHYFNVSRSVATSSLSSSASTSPSSSAATTQPSATTSSMALSENGSKGGLSQDAKIGLGVGIGLGVPTILLLGIIAGALVSKTRKSQAHSAHKPSGEMKLADQIKDSYTITMHSGGPQEIAPLAELAVPNSPRELET